jgi:hypothetical protein
LKEKNIFQIFPSIASLQNHITTIHEVAGSSKKKNKFNPSTLHCEYKYSGITLGDAITGNSGIAGKPRHLLRFYVFKPLLC